ITGDREAQAEEITEAGFEGGIEAAGGQPEIKRGVDQATDLFGTIHPPGYRDGRGAGHKGFPLVSNFGVACHKVEDLIAKRQRLSTVLAWCERLDLITHERDFRFSWSEPHERSHPDRQQSAGA